MRSVTTAGSSRSSELERLLEPLVGTLTFAATLESHRRRGAQSALIAARLRDARRLDLEWVVTETDEELPGKPNPSYHNIVRVGMPVRYVRSNWRLPPPR